MRACTRGGAQGGTDTAAFLEITIPRVFTAKSDTAAGLADTRRQATSLPLLLSLPFHFCALHENLRVASKYRFCWLCLKACHSSQTL